MTPPIRVLIAEDDAFARQVLSDMLRADERFTVVLDHFSDGTGVARAVVNERIDIALLDIVMEPMSGIEATMAITSGSSDCRVVLMTNFDTQASAFDGIRAGARGHILKLDIEKDLITTLLGVMKGDYALSASAIKASAESLADPEALHAENRAASAIDRLTTMERRAVWHMAEGLTYDQIANELHISSGTVKKYLSSAYAKADVPGNIQMVRLMGTLPRGYFSNAG